jgi:hypothetical protein
VKKDDYFERVKMRGGFRWPHKLQKGRVLVHNQVMHTLDTPHGFNGFRCWTQNMDKKLMGCACGWRMAWSTIVFAAWAATKDLHGSR